MSLADSPFMDRLNTNYIPSDLEILEIRALLVDPSAEMARIDAQIEAVEITLGQLKQRRELLKTPIDAHGALISPMRRTPDDLLREIFFFCLPSKHNALIDPAEAPMLLGRICSHWRSVAWSTPKIWSSLHIPRVAPTIFVKLGRAVESWLERSGSCALSISLSADVNPSDLWLENHPILAPLLQVSRRLRQLALSGQAELLRQFLQLGVEDLPVLKTIGIHHGGDLLFSGFPQVPNALQIPTVEDISLTFFDTIDPRSLPLRWSQLTSLSLICYSVWTTAGFEGSLDVGGIFEVLRRCPNLVQCRIRTSKSWDPGSTIDTSLIALPHLQSLLLSTQSIPPEYMSCLVLPKLCYLQYGIPPVNAAPFWDARAPDSSLQVDIDSSPQCLELLQCFPNITHLRLFSATYHYDEPVGLDDTLLACFYAPNDVLCPILTHLTVLEPCAGFSDAAALAFVKARMAMPSPYTLQQFRVFFGRPMEVDIMADLEPFISEDAGGLQVALNYTSSEWGAVDFNARDGLFDALGGATDYRGRRIDGVGQ